MIAPAWLWLFWPLYVAVALVGSVAIGIGTHFAVEYLVASRQSPPLPIEESFNRVDALCGTANEFALPALILAVAAFGFFGFIIHKYFAPRWVAAH